MTQAVEPEIINYVAPKTIARFIKWHLPGELFYSWCIGPFGCLPADSEYLTPSGWRRMDAYAPGHEVAVYDKDTGTARFEQAEYVSYPTTEPFYRFDSGSLEMELSPEHTVLYDDYRGVRRTCTAARMAEAPSSRTIPTTFALERPDAAVSDADIRLRVAFSADGHLPKTGQQALVTVRKERKKTRLRELLADCGLEWTEATYEQRPTETRFTFRRRSDLNKSLCFVWDLSTRQLEIVLDECLKWDGCTACGEHQFSTTVKAHADAIQFAAHATGLRASIHAVDDDRNPDWATCYTVRIRTGDNAKNRAMVRKETRISRVEAVDGRKYCFHTSTGFFVARCNGKVFVTGNSAKTTGIFFKLVYMCMLQAPGPDGIRRTRAVIIRNTLPQLKDTTMVSWNYWFKEGIAGEWNLTDKIFTLRFGDCECEVMFRALDTPADIARVLSLEIHFALIDEFVEIPRAIVDALSPRLGRYRPNGVKATVWGMWGSSNTSSEDCWWFDHLHGASVLRDGTSIEDHRAQFAMGDPEFVEPNAIYFHQPGGFHPDAENLENLPGGRGYYTNQARGKSKAWIKQFIDSEWGFSVSGQPVVTGFNPENHIAKKRLKFNPMLALVIGLDPGITGSAMIIMQEDYTGCVNVLGEVIQRGYGAKRMIVERLMPYLKNRFPQLDYDQVVIAPDPAAANRAQTDEKSVVKIFKEYFENVVVETNNRFPLRLEAYEHYCQYSAEGGPGLQIDPVTCPIFIRALKGGWRYAIEVKKDILKGAEPEKNAYSHPGDAGGYGLRYFHKGTLRMEKYGSKWQKGIKRAIPTPQKPVNYHIR